jgi:hypothetical protein
MSEKECQKNWHQACDIAILDSGIARLIRSAEGPPIKKGKTVPTVFPKGADRQCNATDGMHYKPVFIFGKSFCRG